MGLRLALGCALLCTSVASQAAPDLSGIWMLRGLAAEGDLVMTDEARRIQSDYDLLVDDPSLYCEPASSSRVWANPNVRIAFDQNDDRILISYEFFDLRREIPIGDASSMPALPSTRNVAGTYFDKMGSSFARYENDRLIIETRNLAPGYIRTSRGVPQSSNTVTIEELWREGDTLRLVQTYVDATLFEKPFRIDYTFEKIEGDEVPLYDCTDADYDWFEKLNAPNDGEMP